MFEPNLPYVYVPKADWPIIKDTLMGALSAAELDTVMEPICDVGTATCKWASTCEAVRTAY